MKKVTSTPASPKIQSKQSSSGKINNSKSISKDSDIAIIGLGCWYPGASNPNEFWENIVARRREFRQFIAERLPLEDYYDPDPQTPDKTYASKAAYIDGFDFDWSKWRIPKRTYEATDITQWLALDIAAKAIEDAGYTKDSIPRERTGAIVGNTLTGEQSRTFNLRLRWPYVLRSLKKAADNQDIPPLAAQALAETMETIYKSPFPEVNEDSLQGGLSNTIAGRICNYFDLHGGGYTVDGACSSSLLSVCTASNYLANRDWDLAIAGGIDISLDTFELVGFAKTAALSPDDMFVYDERARGFLPGEGCGFVILKRLADARRDGDKVYAAIRGWGISSDGKGGITAPSSKGQSRALIRAYQKTTYSPHDLHFIEGHGTGTPLGDKIELQGIAKTMDHFGDVVDRQCGITSLKSIIGHTKAAAGIGALIKTTIAVNRRIIPPTAGCTKPNAIFENEAHGLYPVLSGEQRPSNETLRAGISAMGFGGINSHITIESADPPYEHFSPKVAERALFVSNQETEVFPLSAITVESLQNRLPELAKTAELISLGDMVDWAADLATNIDPNAPLRAAIIAHDPQDLAKKLSELHHHLATNTIAQGQFLDLYHGDIVLGFGALPNRIGFLLPGQGSQQLNMGRVLVERYPWAQNLVGRVDDTVREHLGRDLSSVMFRPLQRAINRDQLEEWETQLTQTDIAQPAICLTSLLYTMHLQKLGIRPVILGGHSLGEITALHLSGAISEKDFFDIAVKRGMVMNDAVSPAQTGSMAALACSKDQAAAMLKQINGYVTIANINSPRQVVLSGDTEAIQDAIRIAKASDIRATSLKVSSAFHSDFMAKAADKLKQITAGIKTQAGMAIPIISAVTARQLNSDITLNNYLANQCVQPVNFIGLARQLSSMCDWAIEVGPGRVLSFLTADIFPEQEFTCYPIASTPTQDADLNRVIGRAFVSGHKINWSQLYEQRLVRPFVPKPKRNFIANPCEKLAVTDSKDGPGKNLKQADDSTNLIMESLDNEFDGASIKDYLQHRRQFITDVIKADIRSLQTNEKSGNQFDATKNMSAESLSAQATETSALEITQSTHSLSNEKINTDNSTQAHQESVSNETIQQSLINLVADISGYSIEHINLSDRLLDDLNLDSIKAAEFIAQAAKTLNVAGQIEPASLANATIQEIALALVQQQEPIGPTQKPAQQSVPKPEWVRNFKIELQAQPLEQNSIATESWATKSVLILFSGDDIATAVELADSLAKLGAKVNSIHLDDTNAEHISEPISELTSENSPDCVIGIFPPFAQQEIPTYQDFSDTVQYLHRFVAIVSKQKPHWVSFINYQHSATESATFAESYTGAFARSLALENPRMNVSVINLNPIISAHVASTIVVQELSQVFESFKEVTYENEKLRLVPQAKLLSANFTNSRSISWSAQDVIVVTGGGKGITAECALALAYTGATFALVGSSPFNEDKSTTTSSEISNTLQRFHTAGLQAKYYACDVTSESAVKQLVDQIDIELGSVTGVIHGAGSNLPNRAERVELSQALKETSPKILGAINLIKALASAPPKIFVSLTSIIGVTGMEGNAWYAFANDTLDKLMGQLSQLSPATQVLSVAFSVWGEIGMGRRLGVVEHLSNIGIGAIPTQEGTQRFAQLFKGNPGARQVIVSASLGELPTWRILTAAVQPANNGRFTEQIDAFESGVSLTARTRLSLEQDPYLADHDYRGSLLFPTVFGMEAMAQVTATLLGCDINTICRFEEINLERPIVVDPEHGQEIEIFALAEEITENDLEKRVHVAIRCESTGYSKDHFSAIVVAGKRATAPKREPIATHSALQVNVKTDLYGSLLFQGPLFQNIDRLYSLDNNNVSLSVRENAAHQQYSYALHNPFMADSLLQSLQFPCAPNIYLPTRIDRWELYNAAIGESPQWFVSANSEIIDTDTCRGNVTSYSSDGTILEQITGYWVKKVEDRAGSPSGSELASLWAPEVSIDLTCLREAFHARDRGLPIVTLMPTPGIHSLRRDERHEIEQPIVAKTLRRYYDKKVNEPLSFELTWLTNGKPMLVNTPTDLGISISHDDNYCLCVIGGPDQGCDIMPVLPRSTSDWIALLGPHLTECFKDLVARGLKADSAGTRVMAAFEAAQKISCEMQVELKISPVEDHLVSFTADVAGTSYFIPTISVNLTSVNNKQYIIAIAGRMISEPANNQHPVSRMDLNLLTNKASSGQFSFDDTLQRPVFEYVFRTTFKESARLDRRVIFSSYPSWKGKLRELAMMEIGAQLAEHIATGEWGLVTNTTNLTIYGEAQCYDLIKGRFWVDEVIDSTIQLKSEFQRLNQDNTWSTIAVVEQDTTWVKIIGHGKVIPAVLPDYFTDFFNKVYANVGPMSSEQLSRNTFLNPGDIVATSSEPPQARIYLHQEVFSTTLEDSNLVGNLYYTNYFSWQGRVMDFFLHNISPEYFKGVGEYGEWNCLNSRMDYLRDAMPFDRIKVTMTIKSLFRKGAIFEFLYFRQLDNGKTEKLAVGQQTAVWTKRSEDGNPMERSIPKPIRLALQKTFESIETATSF